MSWLVDTNVLSELARPRPNAAVVEHVDRGTVTRNVRDFEGCRIVLLNPFSA